MIPEQAALETELRLADIAAEDARERRAIRHARIFAFCANMAVWIAIGAAVVAWWNGWSVWR